MKTKRRLGMLMQWHNQSDYYYQQLADIIADHYESTLIFDEVQDPDQYDLFLTYFANRNAPEGHEHKLIKRFASHIALHLTRGAVNIASSTILYDLLKSSDPDAVLLPLGINPQHFNSQPFPSQGVLKVGWAGPDTWYKRLDELTQLIDSIPRVELLTALYTANGGIYKGPYETRDMAQFYRQIHVYACASLSEGFGCPLLEASACGRPVVTFDVGIAKDLLCDSAGVVIVEDFDGMRKALEQFRDDKLDYRLLGRNSAVAVEKNWTWHTLQYRWLGMLDDAYEYSHG